MMRALGAALVLCCGACAASVGAASVRAADVKPVATVKLPCEPKDVDLSKTGTAVVVMCADKSVHVVDVASGKELFVEPATSGAPRISAANLSRDGKWLGFGFWDGTVKLVPLGGGAAREWKVGDHRVHTIEFLPDGHSVVAGSLGDAGQVWDFGGAPKVVATLHSDFSSPTALALSPDGTLLATAGGDAVVRIYDTSTWKMLRENRSATKLEMFAMDFTPDGKSFLTGGADDSVLVIDAATGAVLHKLSGQPGVIEDISVLGDGAHATAVYEDLDDLKKPPVWALWDLRTQKAELMPGMDKYTAHGVVNGKLWLAAANGTTLDIFEYK